MFALTRKIGQRVMINDDIAVSVLSVKGGQVSIGFDAPIKHKIHREEVYRRIQKEQLLRALIEKADNPKLS